MIANPLKDYGISDRISVIMVERIKKRALRGAVRLLYLLRIVLVALSCLLGDELAVRRINTGDANNIKRSHARIAKRKLKARQLFPVSPDAFG